MLKCFVLIVPTNNRKCLVPDHRTSDGRFLGVSTKLSNPSMDRVAGVTEQQSLCVCCRRSGAKNAAKNRSSMPTGICGSFQLALQTRLPRASVHPTAAGNAPPQTRESEAAPRPTSAARCRPASSFASLLVPLGGTQLGVRRDANWNGPALLVL